MVWNYSTASPYNWSSSPVSNTYFYPGQHTSAQYTDTATINGNANAVTLGAVVITLGGSPTVLTIGSSGGADALTLTSSLLEMQGSISNARNINVNSATLRNDAASSSTHYSIGGGGTITMAAGTISSLNGGVWDFHEAVTGYGTISAPVNNYSTVTANNATALTISGAFTNEIGGVLNVGTSPGPSTGQMVFNAGLSNSGTVNVYGTLTNNSGSAMALTPSFNLLGGTLNGSNGFTNASTWTGYGTIAAALNNSGTINVNPATTLIFGTGGSLSGTGIANVSGTLTNSTATPMALSLLNLQGGTLGGTGGFTNLTSTWSGYGTIGKLTNTGTLTANNGLITLNAATNNTGGTLAVNGTGSFTNSGTFTTDGTISVGTTLAPFVNTGTITAAATKTVTLTSVITGPNGILSAPSGTEFDLNGATLSGQTFSGAGTFKLMGTTTFSGTNNFSPTSPGTFSLNGQTLNLKGGATFGASSNVNLDGGTLNNSDASATAFLSSSASQYSFVLAGGSITSAGGAIQGGEISGWGTISAPLKFSASASGLTASGGTMTVTGPVDLTNANLLSSSGGTLDLKNNIVSTQATGGGGYINPQTGIVNLDGTKLTAGSAADPITIRGGTVNVIATSTFTGPIVTSANITINPNITLDMSGASVSIQRSPFTGNPYGSLTNNGTFVIGGATLDNAASPIGAYTLGGTGVAKLAGGTISASVSGNSFISTTTLRGYGTVSAPYTNNGNVTADGAGTGPQTLTFASPSTSSVVNLLVTKGWFATNQGKLMLPSISVLTSTTTTNWGGDPVANNMVNSIGMTFSNVKTPDNLSIALLSTDRGDVPTGLIDPIGVWQFTPGANLNFGTVGMTFRYDDAAATKLGVNLSALELLGYTGTSWVVIPTNNNINNATPNDSLTTTSARSSFYHDFAVAEGVVPEPATIIVWSLLGATWAGLAVVRRRWNRSGSQPWTPEARVAIEALIEHGRK